MTKILIIEDEPLAARHLQRIIAELVPDADVPTPMQSIEEAVEYFSMPEGEPPDLVFMDIELADGSALRIFDRVDVPAPVIFTTAYDQYALDAFRAGGIDYLLKPLDRDDVLHALTKLSTLRGGDWRSTRQSGLAQLNLSMEGRYPSHFLVPVRDKLIPVGVADIAYLHLDDKITRATFYDGRSQIIDKPLEALMQQLDPAQFFRANRQYIVARRAIKDISLYPISKLQITLTVPTPDGVIVSKARVHQFKQWFTT